MMKIESYEQLRDFVANPPAVKPKLLLHACCAPCASYVLAYLEKAFAITIFFYNPNIYPAEEFSKRLEEFKKFPHVPIITELNLPDEFDQAVVGLEKEKEGGARCFACYEQRLEKTALKAKEYHFDYFTTTLSVSPHKNAAAINQIGNKLAAAYGVSFLYSNFKKNNGFQESVRLSQELGLYRQDYCGCIYSFQEKEQRKPY